MSKATTGWLIAAFLLIAVGILLLIGGTAMMDLQFPQLSTNPFEVNEHTIEQPFTNLSVVTNTARVQIIPFEGDEVRVTCREWAKQKHTVTVNEDTLTVEVTDTRKWYDHISIHIDNPEIIIELPAGEYGDLRITGRTGDAEIASNFRFADANVTLSTGHIHYCASAEGGVALKTSTGRIRVDGVTAAALDVTVSTGGVELNGVRCAALRTVGNTGNVVLTDVIADTLRVERSTGGVRLDDCDAGEMVIITDTGDVVATLLSGKTFVTHTDTGRVTVPDTHDGGRCEITTDTGNIHIEIEP